MQTMQSNLFHCKITLHISGVTAPIIRSAKNSNRSLRYRSAANHTHVHRSDRYDLYRRLRLQFLALLMMGAVTPETCRAILQ